MCCAEVMSGAPAEASGASAEVALRAALPCTGAALLQMQVVFFA